MAISEAFPGGPSRVCEADFAAGTCDEGECVALPEQPYAGKVWLNLAAARRRLDPDADVTRPTTVTLSRRPRTRARRWRIPARTPQLRRGRVRASTILRG